MSITLTYNGTTAHLGDRLVWTNEFEAWAVKQKTEDSTTGKLLVHVGVRAAGRPITLDGVDSKAWTSRSLVTSLYAWASLPGITMTLVIRGVARPVIFDHDNVGFEATPVWKLADGQETPDQVYLPVFRFLTVEA